MDTDFFFWRGGGGVTECLLYGAGGVLKIPVPVRVVHLSRATTEPSNPCKMVKTFKFLIDQLLMFQENERISVYTEVIGRVNNMIVFVDNPLNPFFAQTIFTNWVLYLALKSGTEVTFVSSKKPITELFENLAEKYENVFNLFQQFTFRKNFQRKLST